VESLQEFIALSRCLSPLEAQVNGPWTRAEFRSST
jgi:hypothetical protein